MQVTPRHQTDPFLLNSYELLHPNSFFDAVRYLVVTDLIVRVIKHVGIAKALLVTFLIIDGQPPLRLKFTPCETGRR